MAKLRMTCRLLCRRVMMNSLPPESSCSFSTGAFLSCTATAPKESPHTRNKEKFDTNRLCLNVGTLGASQHGKTTLTSAITRVLSQSHGVPFKDMFDIDHTPVEQENGHSQNTKHLEWWTDDWFVAHSDLPGLGTYVKNMLAPLPALDIVFLCVRADLGVVRETLMHYHVAKHLGVPTIVPFINVSSSLSEQEEEIDLVKMELEESLNGEEMQRLVIGNALSAQTGSDAADSDAIISDLFAAMKSNLKLRPRDEAAPFVLHVESSGDIPMKGHFTGGRILQGKTSSGDALEVFVGGLTTKVVYRDVEIFRKITSELRAGDRGGGFIKKANKLVEIKRGSILYDPAVMKDGWKASRTWNVKLCGIPHQGDMSIVGRATLYHRGNSESGTTSTHVLSEYDDQIVQVTLKQEIMGSVGDAVVLRCHDAFFIGHLVNATTGF